MTTDAAPIRLAMLGMIEGNGHPWSWSAIINSYDPAALQACPFPVIREYMGRHDPASVGISGARVTHIWTDNPADAPPIAAAARIDQVVARPQDVIGHVDAVIIATDDGNDHVRRARLFIEAGLPVFVDKPLATNLPDLQQFAAWHRQGKVILSTSGLRYAPELRRGPAADIPREELRWITSFTCKSWERYGIHALEAVQPITGPGFVSVQAVSSPGRDLMHVTHRSGVVITVAAADDAYGSFGSVHIYGTKGQLAVDLKDTYTCFREQLVAFIQMLRTGQRPFPQEETLELMQVIIAGIKSRELGGQVVRLTPATG